MQCSDLSQLSIEPEASYQFVYAAKAFSGARFPMLRDFWSAAMASGCVVDSNAAWFGTAHLFRRASEQCLNRDQLRCTPGSDNSALKLHIDSCEELRMNRRFGGIQSCDFQASRLV
jgi:hypothetical protein